METIKTYGMDVGINKKYPALCDTINLLVHKVNEIADWITKHDTDVSAVIDNTTSYEFENEASEKALKDQSETLRCGLHCPNWNDDAALAKCWRIKKEPEMKLWKITFTNNDCWLITSLGDKKWIDNDNVARVEEIKEVNGYKIKLIKE